MSLTQQPTVIVHGHSEAKRPDRVVVLGGDGFLGRGLLLRLAQNGIESLALTSRELDLTSPNAGWALAERLRPSDSLVMLAAIKPGRRLDDEGFVANLVMGSAVCNAVRKVGCAHVVYISSDAVYPFVSGPIREDVAPLPTSLYALMHFARETMLRRVEGPPLAILRVTQVYGLRDPHDAYGPSRMVRSAVAKGRIVLYGSGEETRDHIHVGDVTSVLLDVLRMRSRGLVNVATGRSISFAGLAELVQRTCGGSIAIVREPRRMPVMHRAFDTAALSTAFPTRTQTPLETGITMMVEEQRAALAVPVSAPAGSSEGGVAMAARADRRAGDVETARSRQTESHQRSQALSSSISEDDASR